MSWTMDLSRKGKESLTMGKGEGLRVGRGKVKGKEG
jgi:hypothetical protein